jgi:hypothetical protein
MQPISALNYHLHHPPNVPIKVITYGNGASTDNLYFREISDRLQENYNRVQKRTAIASYEVTQCACFLLSASLPCLKSEKEKSSQFGWMRHPLINSAVKTEALAQDLMYVNLNKGGKVYYNLECLHLLITYL